MNEVPAWIIPVTLGVDGVHLRPLSEEDGPALNAAAADGRLWDLWYTEVPEPSGMAAYLRRALDARDERGELPFAVEYDGGIAGTTRYCNVDRANRRLEIGYTWYAESLQRTAVNSTCKLLLLEHAFERLGCIAVEFRTHWLNHRSRRAIERLGAKQDGVLRNHRILADGTYRDTVVFSIIRSEWPAVKAALRARIRRNP